MFLDKSDFSPIICSQRIVFYDRDGEILGEMPPERFPLKLVIPTVYGIKAYTIHLHRTADRKRIKSSTMT